MSVKEKVYAALTGSDALTGMLCGGSEGIDADYFRLTGRYPVLVYSMISDVPQMVADDIETVHRVTIQINIITNDGQYSEIGKAVNTIMLGLGFMRFSTNEVYDNDKKVQVRRYVITVMEGEE